MEKLPDETHIQQRVIELQGAVVDVVSRIPYAFDQTGREDIASDILSNWVHDNVVTPEDASTILWRWRNMYRVQHFVQSKLRDPIALQQITAENPDMSLGEIRNRLMEIYEEENG